MDIQNQLEQHSLWLRTFGKEGAKLNLRGAGLRGADLRGADMRGAILLDTDLQGADLTGVTGLEVDS